MAAEDLQTLLDMGFEKERAELAVKSAGGLEGALAWLEKNQDVPLEDLQSESISTQAIADGQVARSLVCNECGKRFRTQNAAEFHASKTEHSDFSESTEEIAPLTEEEKKVKLAELREKARLKKEGQSKEDKELAKRNEQIKMKANRETQDIKEELQKKEQIKDAEKKRAEKKADMDAKARIKAQIEADKAERRAKAEREKAAREGRQLEQQAAAAPAAAAAGTTSKPASAYTETRMRFQTSNGNIMKTFPVDTTLFEVKAALEGEHGLAVTTFTQTFPRKVFDASDLGSTLKELGLVPSTSLLVS